MKILLIQPFKDTALGRVSFPPVGLGYLAAMIRRDGHTVNILDCLKDVYSYDDLMWMVEEVAPDLIGINVFSISVPYVQEMTKIIKRQMPGVIIVLGGPHISSLSEKAMECFPDADYFIQGEGEIPFRALCNGVMRSQMNKLYFCDNPDEYGIPAWDLIKPKEYFKYPNILYESVPVFFSRGCPFSCTFCAAKVTSGQRLRRRSLDSIFEELHLLQDKYEVKNFVIEDEGFGVAKDFIMQFCERARKEKLPGIFAMGTGMRLNIVDRELLAEMKATNFFKVIAVGIESGSQRILDMIKKDLTVDMVREKVMLMDEMGFAP